MEKKIKIESLGSIEIYFNDKGLFFNGPEHSFKTLDGVEPRFAVLVNMLLHWEKIGIAESNLEGFFLSNDSLGILEEQSSGQLEIDLIESVIAWCDIKLEVRNSGIIGYKGFSFRTSFLHGSKPISVSVIGVFAIVGQKISRLRAPIVKALNLISEFNSLNESERSDKKSALIAIDQLKQLASSGYLILDPIILRENIIVVDKIKLGLSEMGKDEVSFYPVIEGIPEEDLKRHFLQRASTDQIYDIDNLNGGRTRVILPDVVHEAIRGIKRRGTRLTGQKKEEVLRNPRVLIPEGDDAVSACFDFSDLGPRVRGIGLYAATAQPTIRVSKESWIPEQVGLELSFSDGERELLSFDGISEAKTFLESAECCLKSGQNSIELKGRSVPVDRNLIDNVLAIVKSMENRQPVTPREQKHRKILLIFENEESLEYSEDSNLSPSEHRLQFEMPRSLRQNISLKTHQRTGVAWLESLLRQQYSRGCLLADDMGLGKTLQILTALAWCIESERFKESLGGISGPYDPILIVAPMTLIPVWEDEIDRFFQGDIFQPRLVLHGRAIANLKRPESDGAELDIAKPTLQLSELRKNRVLLTNYETVRNYQHSLARLSLSVLVLDEAQEIKEPGAGVTLAAKALNSSFRIASTGTPVENNLMNLWSIIDFIQPGSGLVGSQRDFLKNFNCTDDERHIKSKELRDRLGLNAANGHVLRRIKSQVIDGLPSKTIHRIDSILSESQLKQYADVVRNSKDNGNQKGSMLKAIQSLSLISQHPDLISKSETPKSYQQYIDDCPKLGSLLNVLDSVKKRGEKALIFSRSLRMQQILASVILGRFGIDVDIMNGQTRHQINYSSKSRSGMVKKFSETTGFNVIILSPEVAGVGLTINSANHVLHYGRWWNPAKESQATDRAYRIGQERPVHVYYFIAHHPKNEFETFDVKLDRLLQAKERLAEDFLAPSNTEHECLDELYNSILANEKRRGDQRIIQIENFSHLTLLSPSDFELATSLVFKDEFEFVFVTPVSNDRGVDLVAIKEGEVVLVQCKHTSRYDGEVNSDPVDELFDGFIHYRKHVLDVVPTYWPIRLVGVTNGFFDNEIRTKADMQEIKLLDGAKFKAKWQSQPRSFEVMKNAESARVKSLNDLRDLIRSTMHSISKSKVAC